MASNTIYDIRLVVKMFDPSGGVNVGSQLEERCEGEPYGGHIDCLEQG
jgi:hypothetical protein